MSKSLQPTSGRNVTLTVQDKIMHFHNYQDNPALEFLMKPYKPPPVPKRQSKQKMQILLPRLSDNIYNYQLLDASQISSFNNNSHSVESDQNETYDNSLTLKLHDITSKTAASPQSCQNDTYLKSIESQPKKSVPFFLMSKHLKQKDKKIDQPSEILYTYDDSAQGTQTLKGLQTQTFSTGRTLRCTSLQTQTINREVSENKIFFYKLLDFNEFRRDVLPKHSTLLYIFEQNEAQILLALQKRDSDLMIKVFIQILEVCQDISNLEVFLQSVIFLGCFCFDCELYDRSIFFLHQALIISELSKSYKSKLEILIHISACASRLKLYKQSAEIVKKALLYAWVTKSFDQEILCYDLLGLMYFYLGDVKCAQFFHKKYCFAQVEPIDGYFRKMSLKFIDYFEQTLPFFVTEVTNAFILRLSLPILNKFEQIDGQYRFCDQFKIKKYNQCDGSKIISDIVQGLEFTQYKLDYYQQEDRVKKTDLSRIEQRTRLPKKIIEIQLKYQDRKTMYGFEHNITENSLYDVPLDTKIQKRMEKKLDVNNVWEKVQKVVTWNRSPFGIKQDQIYNKHLNKNNGSIYATISRNKERIIQIIQTLIKQS